MLKSQFSFGQYYLQLGIWLCLYLLPVPFFIWPEQFPGKREFVYIDMLYLLAGCSIIGFFGIFFVLKRAPRITITPEGIVVLHLWKRKTIYKEEIKKIELMGSAKAGFIIFSQDQLEATRIETSTGDVVIFFAPFYSNTPAIRQSLNNWFPVAGKEKAGRNMMQQSFLHQR